VREDAAGYNGIDHRVGPPLVRLVRRCRRQNRTRWLIFAMTALLTAWPNPANAVPGLRRAGAASLHPKIIYRGKGQPVRLFADSGLDPGLRKLGLLSGAMPDAYSWVGTQWRDHVALQCAKRPQGGNTGSDATDERAASREISTGFA
jgi:hypothetical protein